MIFALTVLPAILYVFVLYLLGVNSATAQRHQRWTSAAAVGAALLTLIPGWLAYNAAPHAARSAEIAWTQLDAAGQENEVVVGGTGDEDAIGWPNGGFAPRVRAQRLSAASARLDIAGGGGFLRESGKGRILNGVVLRSDYSRMGDFSIRLEPRTWFLAGPHVFMADTKTRRTATFQLRRAGSVDRVLPVDSLIGEAVVELRRTGAADVAARLESWAGNTVLLMRPGGEVRLLDKQQSVAAEVPVPSDYTVLWPKPMLPVSFRLMYVPNRESVRFAFLPPFRLSSPIPDPVDSSQDAPAQLVVTSRPLPDDRAFVFPLRGSLTQLREVAHMQDGRFPGLSSRKGPIRPGTIMPAPLAEGITSEQSFRLETSASKRPDGNTQQRAMYATLSTVQDLPKAVRYWIGLGLALVVLIVGLYLVRQTLRPADAANISGLALTVWCVLTVRFLLAWRFALDPARLDALAVSGVARALVALAVLPGVVLLAARFRRDLVKTFDGYSRIRHGVALLGFVLLLGIVASLEAWIGSSLWSNAKVFGPPLTMGEIGLLIAGGVFLAIYVLLQYILDLDGGGWSSEEQDARQKLSAMRDWFMGVADAFYHLTKNTGYAIWRQVGAPRNASDVAPGDKKFWTSMGWALLIEAVLLTLFAVLSSVTGGRIKIFQEIFAPLLFCWLPAFFWLASRLRFPADTPIGVFRWGRAVILAVAMLLVPVFLLPLILHDAGSTMMTLSVFFSVCLMLLMGSQRRTGLLALSSLAVALFCASLVYLNLDALLPQVAKVGAAAQRLLVFKEGHSLQPILLFSPLAGEDAPSYARLSQGLQHTRENLAMAHQGGVTGLGFGNAPTTLSQIPQDTLQFDSTFSFFVTSEHGLAGGLALLLLFAVPLIFVLRNAREHFDIGHGIATTIAASFFLEALLHVAMNYNALPFTGRSMPLLAVNSNSDLIRWTILFWIAAQAMQWRVTGSDAGYSDACSLVSGARRAEVGERYLRQPERSWNFWPGVSWPAVSFTVLFFVVAFHGWRIAHNPRYGEAFDWSELLAAVQSLADEGQIKVDDQARIRLDESLQSSGGSLLEQETERFNALSLNEKLEGAQPQVAGNFRDLIRNVRSLAGYYSVLEGLRQSTAGTGRTGRPPLFQIEEIDDEEGAAEGSRYRVLANPAFNTRVDFRIGRSANDFMTVSLREGAAGAWIIRGDGFEFDIPDRPARPDDTSRTILLDQTLAGDFKVTGAESGGTRIRVTARLRSAGSGSPAMLLLGDFERAEKGLVFTPAKTPVTCNSPVAKGPSDVTSKTALGQGHQLVFSPAQQPGSRIAMRIQRGVRGAAIGPAWVMGRWRMATDPNFDLPWLNAYAAAVNSETARIGREEALKRYGTLSLEPNVQKLTSDFLTGKAKEHYDRLLGDYTPILPPRVAMTVMRVPSGEVLALGGWPRTTSGSFWRTSGGELLPPNDWVERRAPRSLRTRYHGDRNFDRIVIGSSGKPLWAAAVLSIHRGLDKVFCVTGGAGNENEVFGTTISRPWNVGESRSLKGGAWADFEAYLARSDNRYHIRLGFLGLVPSRGGVPASAGFRNPPILESMDGGASEWTRRPEYPRSISFDEGSSATLNGLASTELAQYLGNVTGVRTDQKKGAPYLLSFWTGDQNDNRIASEDYPDPDLPSRTFNAISPEAANLALDRVTSPRQYINLLLGGEFSMWSNVELAGAFASVVTGSPVVPHATLTGPKPSSERLSFVSVSQRLLPGLRAAVESPAGTANRAFAGTGALQWLHQSGLRAYVKTGTLRPNDRARNTSRILVLLTSDGENPNRGVVLSLLVESADAGTASAWMGEFLASHGSQIQKWLR